MANYDHELRVSSTDGTLVDYYFEAAGFVGDIGVDHFDDLGEKYIDGSCSIGTDVIGFNSIPKGFVIESGYTSIELELDGNPIEPFHLNSHLIEVQGLGSKSSYEISVDEGIIRTELKEDESFEPNDNIFHDTVARGAVVGGRDGYQYWGNITGFSCNVDVDVYIDGVKENVNGVAPTGI